MTQTGESRNRPSSGDVGGTAQYSSSDARHEHQAETIAAMRITSRDPNGALDEIAAATARIFNVPSALITAGFEGSGWHQGRYGLPPGFAASEDGPLPFIARGSGAPGSSPLVAPDLSDEPAMQKTAIDPIAGARYYAGVPLIAGDGRAVGTLYILDSSPRNFSRKDMDLLHVLAARSLDEIAIRIEREQAEKQVEHAEQRSRRNTEMVAWTAHELKNPLTVIKGISMMLTADPKFPLDMRVEFTRTITNQVDRMIRMIDETLDLEKLESGSEIHLHLQEADLFERLTGVVDFYRAASPRHTLELDPPESPVHFMVDRDRFDQVLFNLVGNAVKYSPEGGTVSIRSQVLDDALQVTVSDQGLGMTPEQVGKLFSRFSRVHTESSPSIKGTGLGLYLTKHLVEAHGGEIWVESQPGVGSSFHVKLPRRPVPAETE